MTKTLQLAQSKFTPKKLPYNVLVSEKLDGVPIRMDFDITDGVVAVRARTRQDEHSYSTQFIQQFLAHKMLCWRNAKLTLVGEVTHETYTDFKDISGVVRRQEPQTGLIYNIFDFYDEARPDDGFARRLFAAACLLKMQTQSIRFIPQSYIKREKITDWFAQNLRSGAEGGIIRDPDEKWQPGKRTWGYQKYVQDQTIDLRLHSVEEATSETGVPLGMAGRLNFWYKGGTIGVGPGKLTHLERRRLWQQWSRDRHPVCQSYTPDSGPMACIQYKRDDSYDALRQPTFQHWRTDKDEADA